MIELVAATILLASLAGSEWAPNDGNGAAEPTVQFGPDTVFGSGRCNRFSGRYTFDGASIAIGPLAMTERACAPEVMRAEQEWIGVLGRARTADATHLTLVLKDENGATIAKLRRLDWD